MQRHLLRKRILRASLFAFLLALAPNLQAQQNGLHFDGVNDYIQTNYPGVIGTGPRTVEAWIKTNATVGEQLIVDWGSDNTPTGRRFTVRLNNSSTVRVENKGGGINGTIAVNDGNWHHIAVSYDNSAPTASRYKIYVDGVLDTQGNISTTLNTVAETNLIIGRRINAGFGGYFNGTMDEVRIWNVARTQAEIQANMNTEFCVPPANLTAYFQMNEGTAGASNTTVASISSEVGSYTGTFNGFALTGTTSNFIAGATNLAAVNIDSTVSLTGTTLSVAQAGATYQWVDCNNSNASIDGATSQTFTPAITGNYAVIVTLSGCNETSACTTVTIAEVCEVPTAIAFEDITETGATISWTENDDATAWEVLYGPAGFDPETEGTTVEADTTAETALSDLTDGTEYDIYVRAICDEDNMSEWTGPESFTTVVDVCEVPTAIAFEDITETTASVSWTENDDATAWEVLYGPAGFDPETEGTTVEADTTAEAALSDLIDGTEYDVYVRAICDEDSMSEWAGPESFTTVVDVCEVPTAIAFEDITETGATVSWTESDDATEWEVLYGPAGFDPETEGTTVEADTTAETALSDLTDGTEYEVYVRAICDEDSMSEWAGPESFTTIVDVCEAPTAIAFEDITETTASVSWTETDDATAWEVLYGPTGFDPETEGTTIEVDTTTEAALSDLTDDTDYDVYVRAVCGDDDMSAWEGPEAFTTQTMGINQYTIESLTIYPNPTTDILNINANDVINGVQIFNLTGQKIIDVKINNASSKLNIEKLQPGIYLLQVSTNQRTAIYKIIKK